MSDPADIMDKHYSHSVVIWLVSGILVAFFAWASFTEVNQQVRGTGRIIPAGKVRTIQHLEGGIITDIYVQEGQTVEAQDQLFAITNKRAVATQNETELDRDALLLRQERLRAELENQSSLTLNEELSLQYPDIAATEARLFNTRQQEFREKIGGLEDRRKQKILKQGEIATKLSNLKKEADVARQQLNIKSKLRDTGAISQSQYLDAESLVRSFNTQIAQARAEQPIIKAELAEIQNLINETRTGRKSAIGEELTDINLGINRQRERVSASQDQVDRTQIVSPVKGIVNKIYINTIGGVVKAGEPVADVIPLDETLIVEGRINTKDRGKIWVGLPVVVNISAYDYSVFGSIKGELTQISADSFKDNNGIEFYQVRVSLSKNDLGDGNVLLPGMTADLNILSGKISVMRAILKPIFNIRQTALTE